MQYFDMYPKSNDLIEKHKNKMLGDTPYIYEDVIVRDSHIGSWTEIGSNSHIVESTFGDYSYVAGDVSIIYADIGKYCSIASHVRINPGNHPMWRVTQHHMTYRRKQYGMGENDTEVFQWRRDNRVTIGHDVWIGHGAIIMPGVTVGHGAVIGSGAVVTKDVGPYTIAVGVSAKSIKKRFDDKTIEKLLHIKWWDWDRATLEERFEHLYNLDTFLEEYS